MSAAAPDFPRLTVKRFEAPAPHQILGWAPDGKAFIAWEKDRCATHRLPLEGGCTELFSFGDEGRDRGMRPLSYDARDGRLLVTAVADRSMRSAAEWRDKVLGPLGGTEGMFARMAEAGGLSKGPNLMTSLVLDENGRTIFERDDEAGIVFGWTLPGRPEFLLLMEGTWSLLAPGTTRIPLATDGIRHVDQMFADPRPLVSVRAPSGDGVVWWLDFDRGTSEKVLGAKGMLSVSASRTSSKALVLQGTARDYLRLMDLEGRDWTTETLSGKEGATYFGAPRFAPKGDVAAVERWEPGGYPAILILDLAAGGVRGAASIRTQRHLGSSQAGRAWSVDGSRFAVWYLGMAWIVEIPTPAKTAPPK